MLKQTKKKPTESCFIDEMTHLYIIKCNSICSKVFFFLEKSVTFMKYKKSSFRAKTYKLNNLKTFLQVVNSTQLDFFFNYMSHGKITDQESQLTKT